MDREKRKLNVVVHNLPEQDEPTVIGKPAKDLELFREIIKAGMKIIIHPTRAFRVGRKNAGKPRLLVVALDNVESKVEILKMDPQLRHLTKWKLIYVTPDLSKTEREEAKQLRTELASHRQAGEENLTIRRGKIVKVIPEKIDSLQARPIETAQESGNDVERVIEPPHHLAGHTAPERN